MSATALDKPLRATRDLSRLRAVLRGGNIAVCKVIIVEQAISSVQHGMLMHYIAVQSSCFLSYSASNGLRYNYLKFLVSQCGMDFGPKYRNSQFLRIILTKKKNPFLINEWILIQLL